MKKRIIVVFLLTLLCMPIIRLSAGYMDSYVDWTLDKSVFAHKVTNGEHIVNNLAMITTDGKIAYCIEPGITADKASYYSSTNSINETKLGDIDTKRLSLIGYYGYGYSGHESKEYYMAAQELIWRQMGVEEVYWSSDKYGNDIINIDYYKNEILSLVDTYEIAPKFNFKSKYVVGDEVIIEDSNNVLQGYEVSKNNNVSIDGNNIKIKVIDGDNSFTLVRKENGKTTMFYYKDGYQTIGSFEFPYSYSLNYDINYTYGKIIVNKLDADTKSKTLSSKYATLEGAEYGLYDANNNLVSKQKTDVEGYITFDMLANGHYTVKELNASKGYVVSRTVFRTFVGNGTFEVKLKSYEDIIKNKIIITKVLDDKDNKMCTPEEGIKFGIYDEENTLIKEVITDINGNVEIELPFGKYVLKQLTTPTGIDKANDVVIDVKENAEEKKIVLVNHKLKDEILVETSFKEEILPKTGKNMYSMIFLSLIPLLCFIYEKKGV